MTQHNKNLKTEDGGSRPVDALVIQQEGRGYLVKVKTTSCLRSTFRVEDDDHYYDCEDAMIYVVTDDPKKIYDIWRESVIEIKDIGVGFAV